MHPNMQMKPHHTGHKWAKLESAMNSWIPHHKDPMRDKQYFVSNRWLEA